MGQMGSHGTHREHLRPDTGLRIFASPRPLGREHRNSPIMGISPQASDSQEPLGRGDEPAFGHDSRMRESEAEVVLLGQWDSQWALARDHCLSERLWAASGSDDEKTLVRSLVKRKDELRCDLV